MGSLQLLHTTNLRKMCPLGFLSKHKLATPPDLFPAFPNLFPEFIRQGSLLFPGAVPLDFYRVPRCSPMLPQAPGEF